MPRLQSLVTIQLKEEAQLRTDNVRSLADPRLNRVGLDHSTGVNSRFVHVLAQRRLFRTCVSFYR